MDPLLNFISLKPNSAHQKCEYSAPSNPENILLKLLSIMIAIVSIVLTGGEANMAALGWLCQEPGGEGEILTDANLFCVHALMCVNRQSRPWDQRRPCSDYLRGLN